MEKIELRSDVDVELVQAQANDESVAYSARVSTLGELSDKSDEPIGGLINFLMKNRHGTPFEHNFFTFRVQAPIFVFREFHRHRVGWSYNEESARYTQLKPHFYIPDRDRPLVQTGKTGHYEFVEGTDDQFEVVKDALSESYLTAYAAYRWMILEGVAKEVARSVLPVGIYSTMYASCNARSLMSFLSLRTRDEGSSYRSYPQREIEMVAEKMEISLAERMPLTYTAFNNNGRVSP